MEAQQITKGVPAHGKVPSEPLTTIIAKKSGYVIFKFKKYHFCTNDLYLAPSKSLFIGENEEEISTDYGLGKFCR